MSLDALLWIVASVAEAGVVSLLLYRRAWQTFPIFLAYSVWTLIGSLIDYIALRGYSASYATAYIVVMMIDAVLLFGVLVELAWSILRPLRAALPRGALFVVAGLIFALGAAIWPFAAFPGADRLTREIAILAHLQQTFSILRVLIFLALAAFSQLLSIGWRNRELQIATGLGFNSLVGLTVAMLHTHESTWVQYRHLNQFVVASYLCSLLYWIVSFAQQEQERREFTPQMQSFLLAVAGSARATRSALASSTQAKPRNHRDL